MINKLLNLAKRIWKNPKDVWYYFQGNIRYTIYYSKLKNIFIRKYIVEQIEYRVRVMDQSCYEMGVCKMCGCTTIALQMCNKKCEGNCYPIMMNKKKWNKYKKYSHTPKSPS